MFQYFNLCVSMIIHVKLCEIIMIKIMCMQYDYLYGTTINNIVQDMSSSGVLVQLEKPPPSQAEHSGLNTRQVSEEQKQF